VITVTGIKRYQLLLIGASVLINRGRAVDLGSPGNLFGWMGHTELADRPPKPMP
jgi:hypothetical protein